jgi:hypothetical protein
MSTSVVTPAPPESFDYAAFKRAKAEGKPYEAPKPEAAQPEKRASGDERKFRRLLSQRDQQIGELRAKLEALTPKQQAEAAVAAETPKKREDFGTEEEFVAHVAEAATKKALDAKATEEGQSKQVADAIKGYNERMARGPQKYGDWEETLANGKGAALNVDLSAEAPALFWAITTSPYNDDCFYHWLKDSSKLQALIDQYKTDPQAAIAAFHRFEGRVGKDEVPAKKAEAKAETQKADDAAPRKPKPSSETSVRGGKPAPDGAPSIVLEDGVTRNPAHKAWVAAQNRR